MFDPDFGCYVRPVSDFKANTDAYYTRAMVRAICELSNIRELVLLGEELFVPADIVRHMDTAEGWLIAVGGEVRISPTLEPDARNAHHAPVKLSPRDFREVCAVRRMVVTASE